MRRFNVSIGDIVVSNTTKLEVVGFCEYSDKHVYAKTDDGKISLVLKNNLVLIRHAKNNP